MNFLLDTLKNHYRSVILRLNSNWITLVKKVLAAALLAFFILYLSVFLGLFGALPSKKALRERQHDRPSEVYSADGVLLGRYFIHDKQEVTLDQVSESVISALLATEDVRFYSHRGLDFRSMPRVFFKTLLLQESSSGGGSTITQQLAKSLYPRKKYALLETPVNKIREIIIATRLEEVYSKKEILELYLNSVHMGGNTYGVERGARTFFDKPAKSLKTEEAAVLVGMLKASTRFNPMRNPNDSRERRNVVLAQMAKYGFIQRNEAAALQALPLKLKTGKASTGTGNLALYFREMVRNHMQEWCKRHRKSSGEPYSLYHDGLRIYTTIDSRVQRAAERSVQAKMRNLQIAFDRHWKGRNLWRDKSVIQNEIKRTERYKTMASAGKSEKEIMESFRTPVKMRIVNPYSNRSTERIMTPTDSLKYYLRYLNTGLLTMEPETGQIKAWVGGINHHVFKYDHVLSKRQVGSTFKPILYTAALNAGMEPCQTFENKSVSYDDWTPKNADGQYGGELTMVQALARSVNTISAQIIDEVGIDKTISQAHDLGIQSDMPEVRSLALGTAEIPLLEMVSAYATLANQGRKTTPIFINRITTYEGVLLEEQRIATARQVVSPDNAATVIEMMKAVVDQGSASALRSKYGLRMDIAGKTGTTQNQTDGWFIGAIPGLVTGVWVGGENPSIHFRTLEAGQGARTALPIWGSFMSSYTQSNPGNTYRQAVFPEVSPTVKDKLSCLYAQPLEEEEYFIHLPVISEILEKVGLKRKDGVERKKGKLNLWKLFGKKDKKKKD